MGSKTNYLIVKDDVGRSKPATRDLPSGNFAFGKPDLATRKEGAMEVVTQWKFHESKPLTDDNNPRNFK